LTKRQIQMACAGGLLVSFVALTWVLGGLSIWDADRLVDASSFRNAAQLVGTPDLYQFDFYVALQSEEYQATDSFRMFLRPPWYAFVTIWMAHLSSPTALIAWRICMGLATSLFVVLWKKRWDAALAICWSMPLVAAIIQGQDDSLILAGLALGLFFARRGQEFLAGAALALCSIKPNLFVLVPFVLLFARRGRMGLGLSAGLGSLLGVSFLVQEATWPTEFLAILLRPSLYNSYPNGVSLVYLAQNSSAVVKGSLTIGLLVAGIACVRRIEQARGLEAGLCAAMAAAVVTSPHAYMHDVLLVVPFALLSFEERSTWSKALALFTLSSVWTIPFLLATLGTTTSPAATLLIALPIVVLLWISARAWPLSLQLTHSKHSPNSAVPVSHMLDSKVEKANPLN